LSVTTFGSGAFLSGTGAGFFSSDGCPVAIGGRAKLETKQNRAAESCGDEEAAACGDEEAAAARPLKR
jgi:hypothetical protein